MGHDAEGLPSAPASFVNARLAEVTRTSLRASHVADAEMNRYRPPHNRDPRLNEASDAHLKLTSFMTVISSPHVADDV